MPSITGDACAVPCFRSAHRGMTTIEAGVRLVGELPSVYCAMTYLKGAEPRIIGDAGDSWDDILLKLKEAEPNVAALLLARLPALNDPCDTIVKLLGSAVLNASLIPTQPIAYLQVWRNHPQVERINAVLVHYGWVVNVDRGTDSYDFFYYDGDIPAAEIQLD